MTTVGDVRDFIDSIAPFRTQMGFDNAGLLVGSPESKVSKIGVVLDMTRAVAELAAETGVDLIVSHHPVIFHPLKRLSADSVPYFLAAHGIAGISAHTNLDAADGGVNDALAAALGLLSVEKLADPETPELPPMARVGVLSNPCAPRDFAAFVARQLGGSVRVVPGGKPVERVAVCGGAGEDFILPAVERGADALVTGDVRHHNLLLARELGLTLIDAGHFETENVVVRPLAEKIASFSAAETVILPQQPPCEFIATPM